MKKKVIHIKEGEVHVESGRFPTNTLLDLCPDHIDVETGLPKEFLSKAFEKTKAALIKGGKQIKGPIIIFGTGGEMKK